MNDRWNITTYARIRGCDDRSIGTLMQASVDEPMRGRVSSVFQLTLQLFAAGMLLGGLFTAWIGPNETLLLFGGLIGAVSILIFIKSPELRNAS